MSKRRINQQQTARVQHIQAKRRSETNDTQRGLVIAHYGKYTDVLIDHKVIHCKLRQHLGDLVVGDEVIVQQQQKESVITSIEPRKSKFWRLDDRGREKLIAANVTQVFVVMAPVPEPSWLLLDSYLAAIHHLKLAVTIIFNKHDLAAADYADYWQLYKDLNIPVLKTSAVAQEGLAELSQAMQNQQSVFVGQSGVGKSSLIQALLPNEALTVGALHEATGLGTHTTSTARLYQLPNGGVLIDSPGVRDFNLWQMSVIELAKAFSEFEEYAGNCKFRNCSHIHEPGCAVQTALSEGKIALSRWHNYHALLERFNK